MLREDMRTCDSPRPVGRLGVVDDAAGWFNRKRDAIGREQERLKSTWSLQIPCRGLPSVCSQTDRARILAYGSAQASE